MYERTGEMTEREPNRTGRVGGEEEKIARWKKKKQNGLRKNVTLYGQRLSVPAEMASKQRCSAIYQLID